MMAGRFDEVDLFPELAASMVQDVPHVTATPLTSWLAPAPLYRRALTFLADSTLFLALFLALLPLCGVADSPPSLATVLERWPQLSSVTAFLVLVSYFYFVGSWLVWGRTIGGAIFDVRVISDTGAPASVKGASKRWAGMMLSLLVGGSGFLAALLPGRRSLADRLSRTKAISTE